MHLVQSRPPPLLFFKMRKVVNYDFGASTLQGLYLRLFWSKFKKTHERIFKGLQFETNRDFLAQFV